MPNGERGERKRINDQEGGYYEIATFPRRSEIYRVSPEGRSCSVGQSHGHISRERASIWVKALIRDARRKAARAGRAERVDADGQPIPRSPNRRPREARIGPAADSAT